MTPLCTVRSCHLPLAPEKRRLICPRGHSFDVARSGYVNLLQPQQRRSRAPGDTAEAVAARRRFLDRGHAEPLLHAIRDIVPAAHTILDAGCGEGYYLGSLGRGCKPVTPSVSEGPGGTGGAPPHPPGPSLTLGVTARGIDISAAAIDLAARRYPDCQWIVANADRFVPYAGESFDLVLSITGRMNSAEFRRVLRRDGALLVAVAAPDDLKELRGSRGRDRVSRTIETFARDFALVKQRRATTVAELSAQDVRDILMATYRPRDASPQRVTLSLDLLLFCHAEKRDSPAGCSL